MVVVVGWCDGGGGVGWCDGGGGGVVFFFFKLVSYFNHLQFKNLFLA